MHISYFQSKGHSLGEEWEDLMAATVVLFYSWGSFLWEVYGNLPAESNITAVKKDKKPLVKHSDFFYLLCDEFD